MNAKQKYKTQYILRWAKAIRAANILGGKCKKCGTNNILLLEFHHPNHDKEYNVQLLKNYRWSRLEKEVKKCELLCHNCHSELAYKGGRIAREKRELLESIGLTKCCRCNFSSESLVSLVFHHKNGNKDFLIHDYFRNKASIGVKSLFDEIEKCEVICRNCHSLKHIDVAKFGMLKNEIYKRVLSHKELSPKIDRSVILKLKNEGYGVCDIAKNIGCSKSAISMALKNLIL